MVDSLLRVEHFTYEKSARGRAGDFSLVPTFTLGVTRGTDFRTSLSSGRCAAFLRTRFLAGFVVLFPVWTYKGFQ